MSANIFKSVRGTQPPEERFLSPFEKVSWCNSTARIRDDSRGLSHVLTWCWEMNTEVWYGLIVQFLPNMSMVQWWRVGSCPLLSLDFQIFCFFFSISLPRNPTWNHEKVLWTADGVFFLKISYISLHLHRFPAFSLRKKPPRNIPNDGPSVPDGCLGDEVGEQLGGIGGLGRGWNKRMTMVGLDYGWFLIEIM